jgi:hypothetical protein
VDLVYLPLLHLQRDFYTMPRGFERFQEYLRLMVDQEAGDLKLPLVAMNPMAKDHLLPFIEGLLDVNADEEGQKTTESAGRMLRAASGSYKVSLVVSDDFRGGWTNRYASEFSYRFNQQALHKRGFIATILWTSEAYTADMVRGEVMLAIFRTAYVQEHGYPGTLGEMLAQESYAAGMAECEGPLLDTDDLAYTREVLAPHMDASDQPTLIAALFGDEAAKQLGYSPLGLSPRAGLALACSFAMCRAIELSGGETGVCRP